MLINLDVLYDCIYQMNKNIVPVNEVQERKDIKKANPIKGYPIQVSHDKGVTCYFSHYTTTCMLLYKISL